MPIGKEQRESLHDALCRVRDTQDSNRTFHIDGMLSIVVMWRELGQGDRALREEARHAAAQGAVHAAREEQGGGRRKARVQGPELRGDVQLPQKDSGVRVHGQTRHHKQTPRHSRKNFSQTTPYPLGHGDSVQCGLA